MKDLLQIISLTTSNSPIRHPSSRSPSRSPILSRTSSRRNTSTNDDDDQQQQKQQQQRPVPIETPLYDKFAGSSPLRRESAEPQQRPRESEEEENHHILEPGAGPGPGVLEFYTGIEGEYDSEVESEACVESCASYVMARPREMVEQKEKEGGSGNMMVDRLLNDLRINERESIEERSLGGMGSGGGKDEALIVDTEEKRNGESQSQGRKTVTVTPANMDIKSMDSSTPIVAKAKHVHRIATRQIDDVPIHVSTTNFTRALPSTPTPHLHEMSPRPHAEHAAYDPDRCADELDVENGLLEEEYVEDRNALGESVESGSLGRTRSLISGPRSNRAALLRQGMAITEQGARELVPVDFANTPGHKREGLHVAVPSLANPTITPRPNRATLIRTGQITPSARKDTPRFPSAPSTPLSVSRAQTEIFANTPGHKREGKVVVPPRSCAKPMMAVRETRASLLRAGGESLPALGRRLESAFKAVNEADTGDEGGSQFGSPCEKRSVTVPKSLGTPTITPRANRASMLRNPSSETTAMYDVTRPSPTTHAANRHSLAMSCDQVTELNKRIFDGVPGHKRRESLQVASTAGPSMTPRLNRASMLRQDPSNAQPSPSAFHSDVGFRARPLPAFYGRGGAGDVASASSRRMSKPPVGYDEEQTF